MLYSLINYQKEELKKHLLLFFQDLVLYLKHFCYELVYRYLTAIY